VLVATLAATVAYGYWRIQDLERTKSGIDQQITRLEARLASGNVPQEELDSLIDSLNRYQEQAQSLQDNLLYRIGGPAHERAYVERELRLLLEEFGADSYSVPPDFLERVNLYIERYQARDRPKMQVAMGRARKELEQVRRILVQEKLPPDFAYMVLVESAFISESESSEGAAGIWQFTPSTARHFGLRVDAQVDERLHLEKSTRAASRYIRELILDFGSGQAVMLAMAAYNVGPTKVRRAVRRVEDPIKQRNFWYLYRARALPAETREYVPKTIAAMIIGRNPSRFGF
jgi:membrane-bound lytic murein transglycosylase D